MAQIASIVFSILLAFWINTNWEQRQLGRQETAVLQGLKADFLESQIHLEQWLSGNRKIQDRTASFLEIVKGAPPGAFVTVTEELAVAPISAPTYGPTEATLEVAMASGRFHLIRDPTLRDLLSVWRMKVDDTHEDELLIREIVVHQLVPIFSRQLRMGESFRQIVPWFLDDPSVDLGSDVQLRADPELEAVLAERLFYADFVVAGLADIYATQAAILDRIHGELERR